MQKQPNYFMPLALAQMGKFFSHYGVRAVLILYMIDQLQFSDGRAFGISALFCGLMELGGIFGGMIADRFLTLRRAVTLGGWILSAGYSLLLFEWGLFWGLGLIILGGGLFSSNLTALLGQCYSENDPRREKGFTYFYMMQNLGAFLSTLLGGFLAERYGFRMAFAFAASGMLLSNLILLGCRKCLQAVPPIKSKGIVLLPFSVLIFLVVVLAVHYEQYLLPLLPGLAGGAFAIGAVKLWKDKSIPRQETLKLFAHLGLLILFFAAEDQMASSFMIFAERHSNRQLFGWSIPSAILMSVNPLVILALGPFISRWSRRALLPFLLTGLSIGGLAIFSILNIPLSILTIMGSVAIISIAELLVGPRVMSVASEVAAKGRAGFVMGMVGLAFSLAFLLGGHLSQLVADSGEATSLTAFGVGFGKMAFLILGGGLLIDLLIKKVVDAKRPIYERK